MIGASWATVIAFVALCAMYCAVFAWIAGLGNLKELLLPRAEDARFFWAKARELMSALRGKDSNGSPENGAAGPDA